MTRIRALVASADPLKREPLGAARETIEGASDDMQSERATLPRPGGARHPAPRVLWLVGAAAAAAVVALVVTVVVPKLGAPPPAADEPYFATSDELRAAADVVVLGTVDGSDTSQGDDQVRTSVVVQGFVGPDPGPRVVVGHPSAASQPGVDLRDGGQYVLLLDAVGDGGYVLVSVGQGVIPVEAGQPATPTVLAPETLADLGVGRP